MSDIKNDLKKFLTNHQKALDSLDFNNLYFGWLQYSSDYPPIQAMPLLSKAFMSVGLKPWTYLTSIEIYSFYRLKGLGDVVLSPDVEGIYDGAFAYSDINTIKIPDTIKYIETTAFDGCINLRDIYYMGSRNEFIKVLENSGWSKRQIESTLKYCLFNK